MTWLRRNLRKCESFTQRRCHITEGLREPSWWRHRMETFSALLAICAGNSLVPSEFRTQSPVTRSFDVYFDLRPNKRLSKQPWGWWFETPSWSLWRQWNESKSWSKRTLQSQVTTCRGPNLSFTEPAGSLILIMGIPIMVRRFYITWWCHWCPTAWRQATKLDIIFPKSINLPLIQNAYVMLSCVNLGILHLALWVIKCG